MEYTPSMRLLSVATILLAATVLAAKPTFQDVLKKFPITTLPITIKHAAELKTKLTAADVDALGILKDTSPQLDGLRSWKKKAEDDETKTLWPIASVQRTGYQLLVLRYDLDGRRRLRPPPWPRAARASGLR